MDDIERAYKELSEKYLPDKDKSPLVDSRMIQINEAYYVLSDTFRRKLYDLDLAPSQAPSPNEPSGDKGPRQIFTLKNVSFFSIFIVIIAVALSMIYL